MKGRKWDNCNSIINTYIKKKEKKRIAAVALATCITFSLWKAPIFYVRLAWKAAVNSWLLFNFGDVEQKYFSGRHFPDILCEKKKQKLVMIHRNSCDGRILTWLESKEAVPAEATYACILHRCDFRLMIAQWCNISRRTW